MAQKKRKGRYVRRDEDELEREYRRMTGRYARKPTGPGMVLKICIVILLIMALLFIGVLILKGFEGSAQPFGRLSIAGVDVTGMTVKEAKQAVKKATSPTYTIEPMVIQVLDTRVELQPSQSEAKLDVDTAVENAFQQGLTGEMDILPYLDLNTDAIQAVVDTLGETYGTISSQTFFYLDGTAPDLSAEGIDTPCQTLVITLGTPEYGLDTDMLYESILQAYNRNRFFATQDCTVVEPADVDLDSLYEECYVAPTDAVMDPDTFEITPESYGYCFDLENAKALLGDAGYGDTIQIPLTRIAPEVTAESLGSMLYRDVLASFQTPHTDEEGRNTNLRLACEAIHNYVVLPGETFSYNEVLGERTEEKGYQGADAYVNGLTVTSIGGGICQVSSTLYYCTMIADLEIVSRRAHSYTPAYMDPGTDAAISWGSLDFQFRNNTDYPIRIEASVSGGYVNVTLIGTDVKDYYVTIEYEVLETYDYDTEYREMEADNEDGYEDGDVIVTPYTGQDVKTYKCKYDRETGELLSREYEATSNYKVRNKVIAKIITPTETTENTETDPTEETKSPYYSGSVGEDTGGVL